MAIPAGNHCLGPADAGLYQRPHLRLSTNEIRVLILARGTKNDKPTCCLERRILQVDGSPRAPSSPTRYAALSYVWGSPANPRAITCNGADFFVSRNLFDALVALQTMPTVVPNALWIDAICINQADNDEKTKQIALMGAIYSRAPETIIWLGAPGLLTGLGFQALRSLSQDLRVDLGRRLVADDSAAATSRPHPVLTVVGTLARVLSLVLLADPKGTIWRHSVVLPLLRREYFGRIWTAQEFALSGNRVSILCGGYCIGMDDFILGSTESIVMGSSTPTDSAIFNMFVCRGLLAPRDRSSGDRDAAWSFARLAEARGAVEAQPDLLSLLNLFRCSAATDPVDKIFGLTGLSKTLSVEGAYDVDDLYPQRAPGTTDMRDAGRVKSTYVAVAWRILERQQSLRLLGSVYRHDDGGRFEPTSGSWGLPSWVPDWSDTRKVPRPFHGIGNASEQLNIAASVSGIDSSKLVLRGTLLQLSNGEAVDRIVKVGVVCDPKNGYRGSYGSRIARAVKSFVYMEMFYRLDVVTGWAEQFLADPAALPWDFILTATGGSAADDDETRRRPAREMLMKHRSRGVASVPRQVWVRTCCFLAYLIYTGWGESMEEIGKAIAVLAIMMPATLLVFRYVSSRIWPNLGEPVEFEGAELRRMAQMASRRLVLGPAATAPGDVIALCRGGSVPIVLRPVGLEESDIDRVEDFHLVGEAYVDGLMDSSQWAYETTRRICLI